MTVNNNLSPRPYILRKSPAFDEIEKKDPLTPIPEVDESAFSRLQRVIYSDAKREKDHLRDTMKKV